MIDRASKATSADSHSAFSKKSRRSRSPSAAQKEADRKAFEDTRNSTQDGHRTGAGSALDPPSSPEGDLRRPAFKPSGPLVPQAVLARKLREVQQEINTIRKDENPSLLGDHRKAKTAAEESSAGKPPNSK